MDWSDKKRLELVLKLTRRKLKPLSKEQDDTLVRIDYLLSCSDEFLEANKQNFSDILEEND